MFLSFSCDPDKMNLDLEAVKRASLTFKNCRQITILVVCNFSIIKEIERLPIGQLKQLEF